MATQTTPSGVCTTCSQPTTTRCASCAGTEHTGTQGATFYCSKECQGIDWGKHKAACQPAQGRKKLFRAAELIQETFLALKSEILDFNVTKVERAGDGTIDFYDQPFKGPALYGPAANCLDAEADIKRAVISYLAGGDVFADTFYSIVVKAFAGKSQLPRYFSNDLYTDISAGYTTKIEELDVCVLDSHVLVRRHSTKDTTVPITQSIHHLICVTLKDGTTWAVDPAGAQHYKHQPVLPFDTYKYDSTAKILAHRPYGSSKLELGNFTSERHPHQEWYEAIDVKLGFIMDHVTDELEEWQHEHGSISDLIKAKASEYSRDKAKLIAHLVTTAREYIKLCNGDPTSTAKVIDLNARSGNLSEEDKQRMKRKRDREMALMDPSVRGMMESQKAQGVEVLML